MNRPDHTEAVGVLRRVLAALLALGGMSAGATGADLRRTVGALSGYADSRVAAWGFGAELADCFKAATAAGATFAGLGRVAAAAQSEDPSGAAGMAIAAACVRLALIEQGVVLAGSTFKSGDEIDAILVAMNAGFDAAEDYAAQEAADGAYRALVALRAAIVRDLNKRGRQLPRVVTYSFQGSLPALMLSNRFYGDAGRSDELVAENAIVHPLFAGRTVRALSA